MHLVFLLLLATFQPELVSEGYVNDTQCAKCHADVAHSFASHGMGRSFWIPDLNNSIEDFSEDGGRYFHEASGLHYRMRQDEDGRIWMKQHELDAQGMPINEVEVEAHFSVGSGNHARTYLHRSPSGELWELPVSWYTDKGWRMSPGYDYANHSRFNRQIGRGCIFCHTAYPDVPVGEDLQGRPITFPEVLPEGIGCQRCHGPGQAHVDLAYSADATDEEIAAAILNPDDLSPELADDLCLQCHMQPSSRLGSLVRPFDRGVFSYRPGEPLAEYLAHIDFPQEDLDEPAFDINHHGYQMQESACVKLGGRISCLECHDAHHKLSPMQIQDRTRTTCMKCHQPEACRVEDVMQIPIAKAQDCASCHMPHRVPDDAIHTSITDHRIQKPRTFPAPPTMDGPPPQEVDGVLLNAEKFKDDPHKDAYPLIGEMLTNDTRHVDDLAEILEDDKRIPTRMVLAQGYEQAGQKEASRRILEGLIQDAPWNTTADVNLATLDLEEGKLEQARTRLESIVELTPLSYNAWLNLSLIHQQQNRPDEALQAAQEAARLRPLDPAPHTRVGMLLAARGDFAAAADALAEAEALMPGDASNGYNLGLARWKNGDRSGAARAWNQALVRSPQSPRLLRSVILTQALPWPGLERDPKIALNHAASFYRTNQTSSDANLMLAIAMLADGRARDLAPVLKQAGQLKADLAAIRLIEAMALAEMGNRSAGREIYDRVRSRTTQLNMLREGLLNRAAEVFGTP
ncbi:MAG: hypothetical protein CMJ39_05505 [Phycisphaerae bacterium]|nr:hypothetical protein [Phycisphaerae bacterium]